MAALLCWTRNRKWKRASIVLTWLSFFCAPQLSFSASSFNEEDLKAAFLYNFADFISWPIDGSGGRQSFLSYCLFGESSFQQSLNALLERDQNTLIQRELVLISDANELRNCDLVFVSNSDDEFLDDVSALASLEILTVSDREQFLDAGGMIQLVREEDRIQVHINLDLVNESGFRVSSQLLRLVNIYEAGEI